MTQRNEETVEELKQWVGAMEKQNHILLSYRGIGGAKSNNEDYAMCSMCGANAQKILDTFRKALAAKYTEHKDWLRSEIEKLEVSKEPHKGHVNYHRTNGYNQAIENIIIRYKEELKVLTGL